MYQTIQHSLFLPSDPGYFALSDIHNKSTPLTEECLYSKDYTKAISTRLYPIRLRPSYPIPSDNPGSNTDTYKPHKSRSSTSPCSSHNSVSSTGPVKHTIPGKTQTLVNPTILRAAQAPIDHTIPWAAQTLWTHNSRESTDIFEPNNSRSSTGPSILHNSVSSTAPVKQQFQGKHRHL